MVARPGDVLRAGRTRAAIDRISGVVLVTLGVRLAAERAWASDAGRVSVGDAVGI